MTVLEEIMKAILVAGAVIWLPCVIGAACWAVRYVRREQLARKRRKYIKEGIIYE